jgi:hypothetical protein
MSRRENKRQSICFGTHAAHIYVHVVLSLLVSRAEAKSESAARMCARTEAKSEFYGEDVARTEAKSEFYGEDVCSH